MLRSLCRGLLLSLIAVGALAANFTPTASLFTPGTYPNSAGVRVGAGGVLVSTVDGSTVNLTIQGVSGMAHGPLAAGGHPWDSIAAVTAAQWAAGIQQWTNYLSTPGKPYGMINTIRLFIGSAPWMGACGIDPYNNSGSAASWYRSIGTDTNGRTIYCATLTGGSVGTVGHEVYGDPTAYRNYVQTVVTNFENASATLGYQTYVILCIAFTDPPWTSTGQAMMPLDQMAMPSPNDIPVLQSLASIFGNDHRVLIEGYNEPYGTFVWSNNPTESHWLGNANGTVAPFTFPTATTSPITPSNPSNTTCLNGYVYSATLNTGCRAIMPGTGVQTATAVSFQQEINAFRAAGGTNVFLMGTMNASAYPEGMPGNNNYQVYSDTYTISGVAQTAYVFHAYSAHGPISNYQNIQNAGYPVINDESGHFISNATNGYTYWRSHNWSYGWCCWASFNGPTSIYPNDGHSFPTNFSILGENPWITANTASSASDTTQVPTGSNFRPEPAVVRLHGNAANDDYFGRLMTGTGMY
jgi:hypothetical protein